MTTQDSRTRFAWGVFCALLGATWGCSVEKIDPAQPIQDAATRTAAPDGFDDDKPVVAYVTNGIDAFWTVAQAGCAAAAKDFNCEVLVRMPPEGAGDQKRMLEELINQGVDGVAVSPINPENQAGILNQVAAATNYITHDSDAPETPRLAYIGMNNYDAGRMVGQVVKEAMPEGGEVMIFVGRLGQLNADLRRQGVIDELLDRSEDSSRRDPTSGVLQGDKYTILDTRTDNFLFTNAKAQAEDAIVKHPNLGCMVGLFSYNPPAILEAIKGAGKLGQIKVVAFDEAAPTLQAIQDGYCHGTVVQDPYLYGYKSVELLAKLARGDRSLIPKNADKFIDIPARVIKQDNVVEFWTRLKQLTSGAMTPADESDAGTSSDATTKGTSAVSAGVKTVPAGQRIKLAFVTNNPSDFWKIAEAGVRKAARELDVDCEMQLPPNGTADDQQRIIEALIARGVAGIAISPNDADNQIGIINQAAEVMNVICHDSDAPRSKRLAYVGTRNYKAGREAGEEIKKVLPAGGKIMIFVGRMDALNAIERANGVQDALEGSNIEILDIRTDLTDRARAKQNVEDTLVRYPDIDCLVGLWSYNGPAILEVVSDADLAGKLPIICFDEEERTLQGVADGHIKATIVQQPFEFGYQSVRILAALARGESADIPSDGIVEIPVRVITNDTVQAFWEDLKRLQAGG